MLQHMVSSSLFWFREFHQKLFLSPQIGKLGCTISEVSLQGIYVKFCQTLGTSTNISLITTSIAISRDILSKVQIAIEIEVMTVLFVMEVSIVETLILLMVIVCSFLIGRLSQQMIMFLTSSLSSDTWMPLFGQRETR